MQMELDTIRIHYKLYNSPKQNTETIVLIHGLGLDLTIWESIIPCLQDHFHILTFDIRGHGETSHGEMNITWDLLVNDFYSLVSNLNISKFHLVGLGFGGNLAIKFLAKYPKMVSKLILTSIYMYFPEDSTRKEIAKRKQLVTNGDMTELTKNLVHRICYNLTPKRELLLTRAFNKINPNTYFHLFELLSKTVSVEELEKIDCEVLLIQGDRDPLYPIQQTNIYQTYLKNSVSYVVPNSSNVVPVDNPYTYGMIVGHFIEKGISSSFISILEQVLTKNIHDFQPTPFRTLEIKIMNGFTVTYKGQEIEDKWNQRKAKNILAYLAYHNPSTRDELINAFWGESDLVSAKNNLRVSLNHLKKILSDHDLDDFLHIERENISLTGDISLDLSDYIRSLRICLKENDLKRKIALYEELIPKYKERMFIDLYDDWLLEVQLEIEGLIHTISESIRQKRLS
ncbi:alpha/beta hydrolase [Ornithinibacillus scapharcae]|uniref:alpha/beta hydrolase n=1 Tax=Ornithinibacillus scapharcae TaxID=1147159 RepID=UPI000225BBF0|nr:alpha/beta hydrolase [Ornithinibacillus scapharcae]